jgi:transcription elongation factor GreB
MSKAFTTDSNDEDAAPEAPPLPPGTKNYMTQRGAARLREEVERLSESRTSLFGSAPEAKSRLVAVERRLRYLAPRLQAAQEVDPMKQPRDRVLFGASVTLREEGGKEVTWRIVGLDETDLARGWISWMSPLASALLEKRLGERVPFRGQTFAISAIDYHP